MDTIVIKAISIFVDNMLDCKEEDKFNSTYNLAAQMHDCEGLVSDDSMAIYDVIKEKLDKVTIKDNNLDSMWETIAEFLNKHNMPLKDALTYLFYQIFSEESYWLSLYLSSDDLEIGFDFGLYCGFDNVLMTDYNNGRIHLEMAKDNFTDETFRSGVEQFLRRIRSAGADIKTLDFLFLHKEYHVPMKDVEDYSFLDKLETYEYSIR